MSFAHGEMHDPSLLRAFPIADKGLKGDVSAKVQIDHPMYTMHSGPPFSSYILTTGEVGALGPTSALLFAATKVKVDPPACYLGTRVPRVWSWLTRMERWMVLWNYPVDRYVVVVVNETEGTAQA